ncbi:MAG: hypothetical protein ACI857_001362 [Arenicella sp.]
MFCDLRRNQWQGRSTISMRLFIFLFVQFAVISLYGQSNLERKVTVSFDDIPLEKCLHQIEKVADISFSYNSKELSSIDRIVKKSFQNESIANILEFLFGSTTLNYKEIGGQISLYNSNVEKQKFVISGYIRDAESKEELIGARIYFPSLSIGCVTNTYGYYVLEIPKGKTSIKISSIGMSTLQEGLEINADIVLNFNLEKNNLMLDAVEVLADPSKYNTAPVDLPTTDQTTITKGAIMRIPATSGEVDIMKYLQQMPGVTPTQNGGATYQVRGSGSGNNLILIDEIPIYHPTHMLGLFSIVNVEAIKSAKLYRDYIPLKFGGRSSSVFQINTNEGNLEKTHLSGGFSPASGRLNLEGPIVKNKASYYLSLRKSFFPRAAFNLFRQSDFDIPNFHDFNGKINIHLNSNNRIYFTGYYGRDRLRRYIGDLYKWGNAAGSFRWNHIINTKTFTNLSLIHSQFDYTNIVTEFEGAYLVKFGQSVSQDKVQYNVTYFHDPSLRVEYGGDVTWIRTFKNDKDIISSDLFLERSAIEAGLYISADKEINKKLSIKGGVRTPISFHFGKQDTAFYLNTNLSTTQVIYQKNKIYDLFFSLDPRVHLSYHPNKKDDFTANVGVTSQHTHLVTYSNNFLPVQIWTTSNAFLRPERNLSSSLGWTHREKKIETSLAVFGRYIANVVDFAVPVSTFSQQIEGNLLSGRLITYGVESQINFNPSDKYSATIGYTYTVTDQKVIGINNDQSYVADNDRPHAVSFSQYFNFNQKWKMSTNYNFMSGRAITLPTGQYLIGDTAFPLFPEQRNSERLRYFSRLDMSVTRKLGIKKGKNRWELVLNVTNLFGRYNPSIVYLNPNSIGTPELSLSSNDYSPSTIILNANFKF